MVADSSFLIRTNISKTSILELKLKTPTKLLKP